MKCFINRIVSSQFNFDKICVFNTKSNETYFQVFNLQNKLSQQLKSPKSIFDDSTNLTFMFYSKTDDLLLFEKYGIIKIRIRPLHIQG